MTIKNDDVQFLLHHADNFLILSHRTSEWCAHAPNVELDIAITNIALDLLGQARNFYQLICEQLNDGSTEDSLAFLRDEPEFLNSTLVEHPNNDFAFTIARLHFVANYYYTFYTHIINNTGNENLKHLAAKHLKETTYHERWTKEWMLRLFFGTDESKEKLEFACKVLLPYTKDFLANRWFQTKADEQLNLNGDVIKKEAIKSYQVALLQKEQVIVPTMAETEDYNIYLEAPIHTTHLTNILSEMQSIHRAHPNAIW